MLNGEIKKNQLQKNTQVNQSNLWPGSWDQDNYIKYKLKQIIKPNSQSIQY